MRIRGGLALSLAGLVMLVAGCSGVTQPIALIASSPGSVAVGEQRLLFGLVDPDTQEFLADPDLRATATFTGPDDATIADVPLEFVWAIPDVRGLYRATVELPTAGGWNVTLQAEGYEETAPSALPVSEETTMPQVGDSPPAVATRTSETNAIEEISTDPNPDPDFYRLSLDEALADDRPTVIVFATPAFCTSQTCGPVLDNIKALSSDHPDVDFLHVEVYENLDADSFEDLIPVEAVDEWALPSEPWVFVTDPSGTITARYEGTLDPAELDSALADIAP